MLVTQIRQNGQQRAYCYAFWTLQRAYLDAADGGSELVSTGLLKHSASDGQRLLLVFTETPYLQQSLDEHAGALGSCLVLL